MSSIKPSLYSFSRQELAGLMASWGFPAAHAKTVWSYLYRSLVPSIEAMDELPSRLRARLSQETHVTPLNTSREAIADSGLTRKYVLRLADAQQIETVLMQCTARATACLSSQAGCALGCVFCATGQMGFARNLHCDEIVNQAVHVSRVLRETTGGNSSERLRNIVLMGMGEPLLNYGEVMQALEIIRDPGGLAIANKRITISTVGVIPGIVRLADERRPYSLAVSLHAASSDERSALVPATNTWPLAELIEACRYYTTKLKQRVFIEWTLIQGVNDSAAQALALAELLHGIPVQINLIPLNPTHDFENAPTNAGDVRRFQQWLQAQGLPTTVRQRRGIEIDAGCGQLAATVGSAPPALSGTVAKPTVLC